MLYSMIIPSGIEIIEPRASSSKKIQKSTLTGSNVTASEVLFTLRGSKENACSTFYDMGPVLFRKSMPLHLWLLKKDWPHIKRSAACIFFWPSQCKQNLWCSYIWTCQSAFLNFLKRRAIKSIWKCLIQIGDTESRSRRCNMAIFGQAGKPSECFISKPWPGGGRLRCSKR